MKLPTTEEIAKMSEDQRKQLRYDLVVHMSDLLDKMIVIRKDIQQDLHEIGDRLERWEF